MRQRHTFDDDDSFRVSVRGTCVAFLTDEHEYEMTLEQAARFVAQLAAKVADATRNV